MKKRLFLLTLVLLLAFSLCACGSDEDFEDDDNDETPTTQVSSKWDREKNDTDPVITSAPTTDTDPVADPTDAPIDDPGDPDIDTENGYGSYYMDDDETPFLVDEEENILCKVNLPAGFNINFEKTRPFDLWLINEDHDEIEITYTDDFYGEYGYIEERGQKYVEDHFTVYMVDEGVCPDYLYFLGTDGAQPVYYVFNEGDEFSYYYIFAGLDNGQWLKIETDFELNPDKSVDLYKEIMFGAGDSSSFNVNYVEADDNNNNTDDNSGKNNDGGEDPTLDASTGKRVLKDASGNEILSFDLPGSNYHYEAGYSYESQPCYYSDDGSALCLYYDDGSDSYLTNLVKTGTEITVGTHNGYQLDRDPEGEERDTLIVLGMDGSNYVCLFTEYRDDTPAIHREIAIMIPGGKWVIIYSSDIQSYDEEEAISLAVDFYNKMFP